MADIELVIKIPEGLKKDFELEQWTALSCMEMKNALEKATPLPKGHGRLGDLEAVMSDICSGINAMTNIGIAVDGEYLWGKLNDAIDNAPTIIEADKESKSKELYTKVKDISENHYYKENNDNSYPGYLCNEDGSVCR